MYICFKHLWPMYAYVCLSISLLSIIYILAVNILLFFKKNFVIMNSVSYLYTRKIYLLLLLQSNWTERWQFIRYSWLASHFVGLAVMIRLMARIKQELESYDFANKSKRTYLPTYILSNSKVMKYDTVLSKKDYSSFYWFSYFKLLFKTKVAF